MAWYNNIFNRNTKPKRPIFRRGYTGASSGRLFADFITSSKSADAEIKDQFKNSKRQGQRFSQEQFLYQSLFKFNDL